GAGTDYHFVRTVNGESDWFSDKNNDGLIDVYDLRSQGEYWADRNFDGKADYYEFKPVGPTEALSILILKDDNFDGTFDTEYLDTFGGHHSHPVPVSIPVSDYE